MRPAGAQAGHPYARWWLWVPGSRFARPGTTEGVIALPRPRILCSNARMQETAEHIVRRATAAFNAGRRDEARQLCEQGLARQPGEAMLSHLLASVLFSQNEISAARGHIETSIAKQPDNASA